MLDTVAGWLGGDVDVDKGWFDPQNYMTEEQEGYRGWARETARERATRQGPTAFEEALRARAMENVERQQRRSTREIEQGLAERGIRDSGVTATAQGQISREAQTQRAETERDIMGMGQERRQMALQEASRISGQDLQAASNAAGYYGQAQTKAEQQESQFAMELMKGLGAAGQSYARGGTIWNEPQDRMTYAQQYGMY